MRTMLLNSILIFVNLSATQVLSGKTLPSDVIVYITSRGGNDKTQKRL